MPAAVYNLRIEQGATYFKTFQVLDASGDPIDLTLYSARMQIRTEVNRATTVLSLTSPADIALNAQGELAVTIHADVTVSLTDDGVYDLELVRDQTVERLLKGKVFLDLEVTR
jgi:hypothetical protein